MKTYIVGTLLLMSTNNTYFHGEVKKTYLADTTSFLELYKYSQTLLSRTRLFRITAYLEVKIWSLF